jgi:hypothetical protein
MTDPLPEEEKRAVLQLPEAEREQYFYRKGIAIVRGRPGLFLKAFFGKLGYLFPLIPSRKHHGTLARVVYSVFFIPMFVLGLIGLLRVRRWEARFVLLWMWMALTVIFHSLYMTSIRYRVATIDPVLIVYAGAAIAGWSTGRECGKGIASGQMGKAGTQE